MNKFEVKLDVITITNKIDNSLWDTLNNVSNQTYLELHHIVIYRKATPEELAKVRAFPHTKKLSIYAQHGSGIASAFNNGIEHSQGKVVLFLNSGDTLVNENTLERVMASYTEEKWLWATGETISVSKNRYLKRYCKQHQTWHEALFWYGNPVCHQSTFYSRRLIDRIGSYSENLSMGMDYEYNIRANLISAPTLLYFPIAYYDTTGVSSIRIFQQLNNFRRIRDRYFQLSRFERFKVDTYCLLKSIYRLALVPAKLWL